MESLLCVGDFNHVTLEPHSSLGQFSHSQMRKLRPGREITYPVSQSEGVEDFEFEVHGRPLS